jgi:hypothetical protein
MDSPYVLVGYWMPGYVQGEDAPVPIVLTPNQPASGGTIGEWRLQEAYRKSGIKINLGWNRSAVVRPRAARPRGR